MEGEKSAGGVILGVGGEGGVVPHHRSVLSHPVVRNGFAIGVSLISVDFVNLVGKGGG